MEMLSNFRYASRLILSHYFDDENHGHYYRHIWKGIIVHFLTTKNTLRWKGECCQDVGYNYMCKIVFDCDTTKK